MTELFGLKGLKPSSPGQVLAGSAAVPTTSATLPEAADKTMLPVASGAGRLEVPPLPAASWIRQYFPGPITPEVRFVLFVPKLEPTPAYCTEYGVIEKSIDVVPRLKISMKSFLRMAPPFPPPP